MAETPPQELAIAKLIELVENEAKADNVILGWEKTLLSEWVIWDSGREVPERVPADFHRNVTKWVKRLVQSRADDSGQERLIAWVDEIGEAFDFNGVYSVQVLERELDNYSFWRDERLKSKGLSMIGCLVIIGFLVVGVVSLFWLFRS